jgi:hypothetical protein
MKPPPPDLTIDDRRNWDFDEDKVPESELVACCYWEYARESAFIREQVKKWTGTLAGMTPELWQVIEIGELRTLLLPDPKDTLPHLFPKPWQEQTPHVRTKLAEAVNFRLEPIFLCNEPWTAKELWEKAERYVKAIEAGEKTKRGKTPAWEFHDPLPVCRQWPDGTVTVMLEINLTHYTLNELSAAFRQWLNTLPGVGSKHYVKQGQSWHKWRVALRRLGIMRLNHFYTRRQLRTACVDAWKRFRDMPDKEWYDAPPHAVRFYRRLFSSLGLDDPIRFRPKRKARV